MEATDEIYLRSDVFSKVDDLQKVVYDYIMRYREQKRVPCIVMVNRGKPIFVLFVLIDKNEILLRVGIQSIGTEQLIVFILCVGSHFFHHFTFCNVIFKFSIKYFLIFSGQSFSTSNSDRVMYK